MGTSTAEVSQHKACEPLMTTIVHVLWWDWPLPAVEILLLSSALQCHDQGEGEGL